MAEILARWSHIIQLGNPEIKLVNLVHAYYLGYDISSRFSFSYF